MKCTHWSEMIENISDTTENENSDRGDTVRFGCRYLKDKSEVWEYNSWDDVSWDTNQIKNAQNILAIHSEHISKNDPVTLSYLDTQQHWDKFYSKNDRNFFKDRHWFEVEFPELFFSQPSYEPLHILELGCGAGNSIFPILDGTKSTRPNLFITGVDFSEKAIHLVHTDPRYDTKRCNAFVFDIAHPTKELPIPSNSVDIVLLVFVMSALTPKAMNHVMEKISVILKPGGHVFFRDYGKYDLAQLRFKPSNCVNHDQYIRGDGTLTFFFTLDQVRHLFQEGIYEKLELGYDKRLLVNRKRQLQMYRVWIQGKFRKCALS